MEKEIIGKFSFEKLNVILKGIRQNTHYEFYFIVNNYHKSDKSADKLKSNDSFIKEIYKSVEQLYVNFIETMKDINCDDRILFVDQRDIAAKAIKYFNDEAIDIIDLYDNMEFYDFLVYINSNPANEEIDKRIKECEAKQGSVVTFQLIKDGKSGIEGFIFQNYHDNIDNHPIVLEFGYRLFQLVQRGNQTHNYPFDSVKENDTEFIEKVIKKELCLLKPFTVNVEEKRPDELFRKHGICINYYFGSKFDIITHKIV